MKNWIAFIVIMIIMIPIGVYYGYLVIDGLNYVATWGQAKFMASPIVPPISYLPLWANGIIGIIGSLIVKDIYDKLKRLLIKLTNKNRSHSS
jgi:hypothetical protein